MREGEDGKMLLFATVRSVVMIVTCAVYLSAAHSSKPACI